MGRQRYALLIGVDVYENREAFPALRFCAADSQMLRRALVRADGFLAENVLVLSDVASTELSPRRNTIIQSLHKLTQRCRAEDLFLLAFCGHAREIAGAVYLLPSDAQPADLRMTGLGVAYLRDVLRQCAARQKILWLDACHSGAGRSVGVMSPAFAEQIQSEGVTVLSACKVSEVAHESEELGHGVFSYFLARGLEGAAASPTGVVTGDGLYRYALREVSTWAADHGLSQTPWRLCEGVGDAVLIGREQAEQHRSPGEQLALPRFHPGSVVPPDFYIDRERELAEAKDILDNGQSFLLVGDRRAGKTSFCRKLIHELMGRPENTVLAAYLNLQQCDDLRVETFLRETIDGMIGEMARQVFHTKFSDLLRDDPTSANPALRDDPQFDAFVNIFLLARKRSRRTGDRRRELGQADFVRLVGDLLEILRAKGWGRLVLFYDEANRLPGTVPVEMLEYHEQALNEAGVLSAFAASPEMAESFAPLRELFPQQVHVGPFPRPDEMLQLLSRYYFGAPLRFTDLPVSADALDQLWRRTAGKPYLIQLLAEASFKAARAAGGVTVQADHVQQGAERLASEKPEARFIAPDAG